MLQQEEMKARTRPTSSSDRQDFRTSRSSCLSARLTTSTSSTTIAPRRSIDPEAFTFQTTVDIDNPEEVEPAVKNALLLNGMFDEPTEKLFREKIFSADDIELWKGKVLHMERSARNKAHIDIRIPVGMTIAEAQSAFCKLIHATEDPSCVTPERIIFITDAASQIYTADDWYKRLDEEAVAEYREAYRKRGLDIDGRPLDVDSAQAEHPRIHTSQNPSSQIHLLRALLPLLQP